MYIHIYIYIYVYIYIYIYICIVGRGNQFDVLSASGKKNMISYGKRYGAT